MKGDYKMTEFNFYLTSEQTSELFKIKNSNPNRRNLTLNEFAQNIIENYISSNKEKRS